MRYTTPLILAAALACTLPLAGCQLFGQDKVPAPKDSPNYAPGTPITIDQYEAEVEAATLAANMAAEKEQRAALRKIDQIERKAQTASVEAINAAKDEAAEIADELDEKVQDRAAAIKAMQVSLAQHRADIEARRSQFETILTTTQTAVGTGLIPGGGLAMAGLGLIGTLFGLNRNAKANSEASKRKEEEAKREDVEKKTARIVDAFDHVKDIDPIFKDRFKANAQIIKDWTGPDATALVSTIQNTYN
jgi:ribosomal protein L24